MYPIMFEMLVGIDGIILSYLSIYMCCFYSFLLCDSFLDINSDSCDECILYMVIPFLKLNTLLVQNIYILDILKILHSELSAAL